LIEIKSKNRVSKEDTKGLASLAKDMDSKAIKWLVSRDPLDRELNSVRLLPWQIALKELFDLNEVC